MAVFEDERVQYDGYLSERDSVVLHLTNFPTISVHSTLIHICICMPVYQWASKITWKCS